MFFIGLSIETLAISSPLSANHLLWTGSIAYPYVSRLRIDYPLRRKLLTIPIEFIGI